MVILLLLALIASAAALGATVGSHYAARRAYNAAYKHAEDAVWAEVERIAATAVLEQENSHV